MPGWRLVIGLFESEPPSGAGSAFGNVNSNWPSLFVNVAKRLSGEKTRAREIGSRVTLLITMPRMVWVLSDADCAEDRVARRQAKARKKNKKRIARGDIRRGTPRGSGALPGRTWRDKRCSPFFNWTAPSLNYCGPRSGKCTTQEPGPSVRERCCAWQDKRPTTAEPVLRSGNRLGADGLPCRAGFLAALHRCAVRPLGSPGRQRIDNDKRRQRLTGIDSHSLLKSHAHLA